MNKATLQRFSHDKVTFGKLHLDWASNHKDIYTIELPWLENKPNISCIPQGLYNVRQHNTVKYPNTFEVLAVPGREAILIHAGNYADVNENHKSDTQGCILIGLGIDESVPMITQSKAAMIYLRKLVGGNNFALEVKN